MPPRCIAQHHHCARASMYSFPPLNSLLPVKAWRPPASPSRVGATRPPGDGWTTITPAQAVADSPPRCSLLTAGWVPECDPATWGDIRTTPTSSRAWSVSEYGDSPALSPQLSPQFPHAQEAPSSSTQKARPAPADDAPSAAEAATAKGPPVTLAGLALLALWSAIGSAAGSIGGLESEPCHVRLLMTMGGTVVSGSYTDSLFGTGCSTVRTPARFEY